MVSLLDNSSSAVVHPLQDPAFASEHQECKTQVLARWRMCEEIAAAPKTVHAIRRVAAREGMSFSRLKTLYYTWDENGRDWNRLANRSKYPLPKLTGPQSPLFIAWWKNLYEEHQRDRTAARAYDVFKALLSAWENDPHNPALAIPGLGDFPPKRNAHTGMPDGFSLDNLRHHLPNKMERTMRRQGPKAASQFLPSVYTSRVGLEFGSVYLFDDQVYDEYINLLGVNNHKTLRPLGFDALELLSGSNFESGLKPQVWNEQTQKRVDLDSLDFFWFVMTVLVKHGYRADIGTHLVFEHGTANVDKTARFEELLSQFTGGKIIVDRSGLFNKPAFKEMLYGPQSTGNFRFKAALEGSFGYLRNYHSALPAQTGRNPDSAPEESYGLILQNDRLSKMIKSQPIDVLLRLQRPVKQWEDWTRIARAIKQIIDTNPEHTLEGFAELGFTRTRYRLSLDSQLWIGEREYALIPAEQRVVLDHIVRQPGYHQIEPLPRGEVFANHRHLLTKLPMHAVPVLAPDRAWRDTKLGDNLEFALWDNLMGSEPMRYLGKVRTAQGHEVILKRGTVYKCLLNFFDPDTIWIAESEGTRKGAFIGVANRIQAGTKLDHASILTQLGEIGHIRSVESKEVFVRMEGEAEARQRMKAHNDALLAGKLLTDEERATERENSRLTAAAHQAFDRNAAPTASTQNPQPNDELDTLAHDYFSR